MKKKLLISCLGLSVLANFILVFVAVIGIRNERTIVSLDVSRQGRHEIINLEDFKFVSSREIPRHTERQNEIASHVLPTILKYENRPGEYMIGSIVETDTAIQIEMINVRSQKAGNWVHTKTGIGTMPSFFIDDSDYCRTFTFDKQFKLLTAYTNFGRECKCAPTNRPTRQ